MQIISFCVFALSAVICVRSTSVTNESVNCTKRVPVARYFEYGFDMTEFDVFQCPNIFGGKADEIDIEIGGKRAKIIDINTCNKGTKYTYKDKERTEYDIPDQFNPPYDATAFFQKERVYTRMGEISEDFIKTKSDSLFDRQYDSDHRFFRNSKFYEPFNKMFAKKSKVAAMFNRVDALGMTVNGSYEKEHFTPDFTTDVNKLPEKFEGNEKVYLEFISKYGTHVLVNATFGGMVYRYAEILNGSLKETEIVEKLRKDAMTVDAYNVLCNVWFGWRQILVAEARDFKQVMVGGFGSMANYVNGGLPLNLYFHVPAILSAEVAPISELFNENKEKAESIEKAIVIHLEKAYIRARVTEIQNVKEVAGHLIREKTNELLLKAEQSKNITNQEELRKLGQDLKLETFRVLDINCIFC